MDVFGLIPASELPGDMQFDNTKNRFASRRHKNVLAPGFEVFVRVARVDMIRRQVDFAPV
jgi:exoribonuclease R